MSILSLGTGESLEEIESRYAGKGYGDFKQEVGEVVIEILRPIQERYNELIDSQELDNILDEGAERANRKAFKTLAKAERAMGLGRKRR